MTDGFAILNMQTQTKTDEINQLDKSYGARYSYAQYRIPIIHAQHYTVNDMFEKKLLILLPYHILRYEHFLKSNKTSEKKLNRHPLSLNAQRLKRVGCAFFLYYNPIGRR